MAKSCAKCGRILEQYEKNLLGKPFKTCRICREISRRASQTCRIKEHQRTHAVPIETYRPKINNWSADPPIEPTIVDDKIVCIF